MHECLPHKARMCDNPTGGNAEKSGLARALLKVAPWKTSHEQETQNVAIRYGNGAGSSRDRASRNEVRSEAPDRLPVRPEQDGTELL